MKRFVAMLLAVVLVAGCFPIGVFAQTPTGADAVTVQGTNGFGTLVAQAIQAETAAEDAEDTSDLEEPAYGEGYSVSALTIAGAVATVDYDTMEDCGLIVALYTEDGQQLLASGYSTVYTGSGTVDIEINGELPQYFYASAYLVDAYDLSPLCKAYSTPLYTAEMQALLASTAADYDQELVLDLGGEDGENFAVYAESTKQIPVNEGVNTVAQADDASMTYVIENADENITGLVPGDVFAYPYADGKLLIVKVDTIRTEGTTATITGASMTMEEAFSAVKLEASAAAEDAQLDMSTADEGIEYTGMVELEEQAAPMAYHAQPTEEGSLSAKQGFGFKLNDVRNNGIQVSGSLTYAAQFDLYYYITMSYQYLEFRLDNTIKAAITLEYDGVEDPVAYFRLPDINLAGGELTEIALLVGLEPRLVLGAEGQIEVSMTHHQETGFGYDSYLGFMNLTRNPFDELEGEIKVDLLFALDLNPTIEVAKGWLLDIDGTTLVGVRLQVAMKGGEEKYDAIHICEVCLDGDLSMVMKLELTVKMLEGVISLPFTIAEVEWPLGQFYNSVTYGDSAFDAECPHWESKITVTCKDTAGKEMQGVTLQADGNLKVTNENGVASLWLAPGQYQLEATWNEDNSYTTWIGVVRRGKALTLTLSEKAEECIGGEVWDESLGSGVHGIPAERLEYISNILDAGPCGTAESAVDWVLYKDMTLELVGEGAVREYDPTDLANPSGNEVFVPWAAWMNQIHTVRVGAGITELSPCLFSDMPMLTTVELADGLEKIGYLCFESAVLLPNIVIPDSVTELGDQVFYGCHSLEQVTLGSGIEALPYNAFVDCPGLKSLYVPDGVRYLDGYLFREASGYGSCGIESISLPAGLESMDGNAFAHCDTLTQIHFRGTASQWVSMDFGLYSPFTQAPNAVLYINGQQATRLQISAAEIAAGALEDYKALESVVLSSSVTRIGAGAFAGSGLTSIVIPTSVTSIGGGAFASSKLQEIFYGGTSQQWSAIENLENGMNLCDAEIYYAKEEGACGESLTWKLNANADFTQVTLTISGTGAMEAYVIDWDAETTDAPWKKYRDYITYVVVEEGVTAIGDSAFACLPALQRCDLPSTLTTIGVEAFSGSALPQLELPGGVTTIADYAFAGSGLTGITLPAGVTQLGMGVFYNCMQLEKATVNAAIAELPAETFTYCETMAEVTLPQGLVSVGEGAFANCYCLLAVDLPDTVTTIGARAFESCGSIAELILPQGLTTIGDDAFYSCWSLEKINLPSSLTYVGGTAFCYCEKLQTISLPADMQGWGADIFSDCGLTSVTFAPGTTYIPEGLLFGCRNITGIQLPDTVTEIGIAAFGGTGISRLALPAGMTELPEGLFVNCENVTSFTFPAWATEIPMYFFSGCTRLTSVEIPNTITTIREEAFSGSGLAEIHLPGSVTTIGDYAFSSCANLTAITIPDSVTSLGANALSWCTSLIEVTLPAGLTAIPDSLLYGCESLTKLVIPADVTALGGRAFWGCDNLSEILFLGAGPETVEGAVFSMLTLTAWYPEGMWTSDQLQDYGGTITWCAYSGLDENGNPIPVQAAPAAANAAAVPADAEAAAALKLVPLVSVNEPVTGDSSKNQIYPGQVSHYGQTMSAEFTGLVPGQEYLILSLADTQAEELLAGDNLLYITQAAADETGALAIAFSQRIATEVSYVMACGPSHQNLADAQITVGTLQATGVEQVVDAVLVYNDVTLTEGVDYVLVGEVSATQAGEYSCIARGIRDYTGMVEICWTIQSSDLPGDLDGSESVTVADALMLANHIAQKAILPQDAQQRADLNDSGTVDVADLMLLMQRLTGLEAV